jgi:hypothetical protein
LYQVSITARPFPWPSSTPSISVGAAGSSGFFFQASVSAFSASSSRSAIFFQPSSVTVLAQPPPRASQAYVI